MKARIIFIALFALALNSYSQNTIISLSKSAESKFDIRVSTTVDTLEANLKLMRIELLSNNRSGQSSNYIELRSDGLTEIFDVGKPNVPVFSKLIECPLDASVSFKILGYDEEIIDLSVKGVRKKIIPAQPSVSKSEEPDKFYIDTTTYSEDKYYNADIAAFEDVGILRSVRLGRIEIRPIQYNPVQNKLRILNNLKIQIIFSGSNHSKTEEMKVKYSNSAHDDLIENFVPNFIRQAQTRAINETYVIVSDVKFQSTLAPFITHKQQSGYKVIVGYTNNPSVGTTTTSIKNYLQGLYYNPPSGYKPPLYVLLVGDVTEIPSFQGYDPLYTVSVHVSDLYYFDYTGNNLPDVFYGRFSASNVNQLIPQIEKTIEYENKTMSDVSYLQKAVLVAGYDSYSGNVNCVNGQINYATSQYFNSSNGITAYAYLQPEPSGANYSSNIKSNINAGVGFANYTAHCSSSGWANPSFVTSDIANLTNANKYGLWVGNCCQSNKFEIAECFGEAALRASGKGAVGYIGGSNSTYWSEDFYWSVGFKTVSLNPSYNANSLGAYDKMFHTHGESPSVWCNTQGQLIVGGNLAVQQSTSYLKKYYWEIYHLMGDPSLNIHINNCPPVVNLIGIVNNLITVNSNTTKESCGDINVQYLTVTGNNVTLTLRATGNINIQYVKVENGAKLILDAAGEVNIIKDFDVELGSGFEIKFHNPVAKVRE